MFDIIVKEGEVSQRFNISYPNLFKRLLSVQRILQMQFRQIVRGFLYRYLPWDQIYCKRIIEFSDFKGISKVNYPSVVLCIKTL